MSTVITCFCWFVFFFILSLSLSLIPISLISLPVLKLYDVIVQDFHHRKLLLYTVWDLQHYFFFFYFVNSILLLSLQYFKTETCDFFCSGPSIKCHERAMRSTWIKANTNEHKNKQKTLSDNKSMREQGVRERE